MKKLFVVAFMFFATLATFNVKDGKFKINGYSISEEMTSNECVEVLDSNIAYAESMDDDGITIPVNKTYGEMIILDGEYYEGATYTWWINGVKDDNTSHELDCSHLNANNYEVVCDREIGGNLETITFQLNISKAIYYFDFPKSNKIEYFEFDPNTFMGTTQLNDVNIQYTKYNGGYQPVTQFDLGVYRAEVELKDNVAKNYELAEDYFDFEIVPTELTIEWDTTTEFGYTGASISPSYVLKGNFYGNVVEPQVSDDTIKEATNVGDYKIEITGLSSQYFTLSQATQKIFNWEIKTTELDVVWEVVDFDYNGQSKLPVVYGVNGALQIPLNVKEILTNNTEFINVGNYEIIAEIPSGYTGFVLAGQNTSVCNINPMKLEIEYIGEESYTYNGEYFEIGVEIVSAINEDILLTLTGHRYKDAGNYIASVESIDNENYYVDELDIFEWQICPKELSVNWTDKSVYDFDGTLNWPLAKVDTGIEGETLEVMVEGELNVHANEDDKKGYTATAYLGDEIKNYTLKGNTMKYWIRRAQPYLHIVDKYQTKYTGNKIMPKYEYWGDKANLVIKANGFEIKDGVVEPGVYTITFTAKKSVDYKELKEVTCSITIFPLTLTSKFDDSKLEVTVSNYEKGLNITELSLKDAADFDSSLIKSVEGTDKYKFYKAVKVGNAGRMFSNKSTLGFKIDNVNAGRIRLFLYDKGELIEKEITIKDGMATTTGGVGEYVLLIQKLNWWQNPVIISIIFIVLFVSSLTFVAIVIIRPKVLMSEGSIYREIKKRLNKKIESGEKITDELIEKTREEVVNERETRHKQKQMKIKQNKNKKNESKDKK